MFADIDDVIAAVNDASQDYLWNDASPLWFRPQYETGEIFRADTYKQVVGHTPVEKIFEKDGIISTDVFSTYRDGRQIGESAMIVIDSETGEYEKIDRRGKVLVNSQKQFCEEAVAAVPKTDHVYRERVFVPAEPAE